MITAATAALALFALGAAGVCARAAVPKLAVVGVGIATALAVTASASAVVGQWRFEECIEDAARLDPGPPTEDELLSGEFGEQTARARAAERHAAAQRRCHEGEALGLRNPF